MGSARLPDGPLPTWLAPARRLDQALWIDAAGQASRVLVTPGFKRLGELQSLPGRPVSVAVGDDGQLVAAVVVTGPGPTFELALLDGEL